MGRGPSGRLVLEVDPDLKRQLHAQVALEGKTLKDWFLEVADAYLASAEEERLDGLADHLSEPPGVYRKSGRRGSLRRRKAKTTRLLVRRGGK